jgi:hypothetical protein
MMTTFMSCRRWFAQQSRLVSLLILSAGVSAMPTSAQVNSGSDGSDGAFHPTTNTIIDMADHPDGIYHYTSVNIPAGVTVTFIPNANNTPVVWLVQTNCIIGGSINLSGQSGNAGTGGNGGAGGWRGGSAGNPVSTPGLGPGGGNANNSYQTSAGGGSYGTTGTGVGPGAQYGNPYLLPLMGGSGGGGNYYGNPWVGGEVFDGGGGGGGAILIAASGTVTLNGLISANGGGSGNGGPGWSLGGGGSGGGLRVVATSFGGTGRAETRGGGTGGSGRIRIDALESTFGGSLNGNVSQGFQPIIVPAPGHYGARVNGPICAHEKGPIW